MHPITLVFTQFKQTPNPMASTECLDLCALKESKYSESHEMG